MLLVLIAAALFVYLRQRADLTESIDHGLARRSDDVAAVIRRSGTRIAEADGGRLTDPEDTFVQILTPEGRRVAGIRAVPAPALSREEARRVSGDDATVFERELPGIEGTARMLARPLTAGDRSRVLVVGISLADRDETLSSLVRSFLIGVPVAVLLASGIGYWLAAAGLAPVEAMRQRAKQVSLERGGRLPLPAAQDEIRRLGETLNEMLARLEESYQRERRFVTDASHELRTPLAVLKAELEAAIRIGGYDAEARESLVVALEETDHLAQLAEDLLLIARAADGRLPVQREQVDVRELLERTRHRFTDRAREQDREIRVDAPAEESVSVDPLRARQALGNLVDNALRHGDGEIRLSARRSRGWIEIDVSDQGPGFPAELEPRVFERFASGDGQRSRSGSGLGLAIVRAIAEAHGATATIVDNSSAAATVRLRFPLAATAE